MISLRSLGCKRDHLPLSNACCAMITAASTSADPQAATVAKTSPVAGLIVSIVLPDSGLVNSPFINGSTEKIIVSAIAVYSL